MAEKKSGAGTVKLADGRTRACFFSADGHCAYWFPDSGDSEHTVQREVLSKPKPKKEEAA